MIPDLSGSFESCSSVQSRTGLSPILGICRSGNPILSSAAVVLQRVGDLLLIFGKVTHVVVVGCGRIGVLTFGETSMLQQIKRWYEGELILEDGEIFDGHVLIWPFTWRRRHWTAEHARNLVQFLQKHWFSCGSLVLAALGAHKSR